MGMYIGPRAVESFSKIIKNSKTVMWNGPMGVFEMEKFAQGSIGIAKAMAQATSENDAFTMVGGGDSVSAINQAGLADSVTFISDRKSTRLNSSHVAISYAVLC